MIAGVIAACRRANLVNRTEVVIGQKNTRQCLIVLINANRREALLSLPGRKIWKQLRTFFEVDEKFIIRNFAAKVLTQSFQELLGIVDRADDVIPVRQRAASRCVVRLAHTVAKAGVNRNSVSQRLGRWQRD